MAPIALHFCIFEHQLSSGDFLARPTTALALSAQSTAVLLANSNDGSVSLSLCVFEYTTCSVSLPTTVYSSDAPAAQAHQCKVVLMMLWPRLPGPVHSSHWLADGGMCS